MNLLKNDKFSFGKAKERFKNCSKKKKIWMIISLCIVVVALIFTFFKAFTKNSKSENEYIEVQAEKGNITETIEQSGVIEPYERYEITSLAKGEIVASPFEEGDFVNEGDTLYQIDDEDAQLTIEKSQNNVEKAQISLTEAYKDVSNLKIYAPASGKLSDFSLKVGDKVNAGTIGTIHNTEKLAIDFPFAPGDYDKISVGDSVTATSALYMTSIEGRVTHKYNATSGLGTDGSVSKNIEIEIENPGALADGTSFAATVHTRFGNINSAGSGVIDGGTTSKVNAETSGEVSYLAVKNGDYVKKGQLLAILENSNLKNSKRNSELNLQDSRLNLKSSQKTLENYNITAPISGTVITKNSKVGDKIDNSNAATIMMVIADVSKMKFTITVDELDISDIKLGQTAVVDADALPDTVFEAKVTSIASEGVSSGNGVTTFSVELTIDEPGELKSGMNVNANILINEAKDVVYIPEDALLNINGENATVLAKSDKKLKKISEKSDKNQNENEKYFDKKQSAKQEPGRKADEIPDGFEVRNVTVGVSDGNNIEIKSGLNDGEIITYIPSKTDDVNILMDMHEMMSGGAPGGGMPGGGVPGGGNNGGKMPNGK